MTMPWFKTYPEARTDLKLRTLTRVQRSVWFDMLCYAAQQSDRGVIKFEDDQLLALEVADGDVDLLNETIEKLKAVRVISVAETSATHATETERCTVASRCITFLNFAKRQGGRVACNAKSSTERSRKFRQEHKLRKHATTCNDMQRDATHATTDRDREEEREKRNTPLTPQGGNDDGGVSLLSQENSTPLRSQRKSKASPEQVDSLIDWSRTVVGQRGEIEDYFQKLPGWACSYPIDWIETAVLCTAAKDDIRPGGMAQYTNKCLSNWHPNGPPKDERATAARQRSSIERSTIPLEYVSDPEWEAEIAASYGRKPPIHRDPSDAIKFPAPQRKAANQ